MKINQIHHYSTNYHVLKIFQDLSIFSFKNVLSSDFNFLTLHKKQKLSSHIQNCSNLL